MKPKEDSPQSVLKPCPFCGEPVVFNKFAEKVVCEDCGATIYSDYWNTRPIEDALNARIAELRDVIGDYRNDVSRVLDEKCPSDERHCGCVPILRDQLNKYQKALILITTMPELSQATTIAREAVQERGKFIWTEQSVGKYWVTKLDILQDKFDTLEKDYADVYKKRLEAAEVFSRQIIELESENAALNARAEKAEAMIGKLIDAGNDLYSADQPNYRLAAWDALVAELEAEIDQLTAHDATERQDDKWIPEVQE